MKATVRRDRKLMGNDSEEIAVYIHVLVWNSSVQ